MINKISQYLSKKMCKYIGLNSTEQEKITYTIEVILTDISKTVLIVSFCYLIGMAYDSLLILLFSIPLRIHIGGFHLRSYWACLLFSTSFCVVVYYFSNEVQISFFNLLLISAICSVILFCLAPVVPKERVKVTTRKPKQLKRRAVMLLLIYIFIFAMENNPYTRYGVWVITIQTIQLLIAKGGHIYEEKKINETTTNAL